MKESLNVLIVDDSEDDARLVLRELRKAGLEVRHERVDTPGALLAALGRGGWDIVLSDYSMPQFDALTALAIVRDKDPDLPFLVVSGSIGEETAVAAMKAGVNDYVMKDRIGRLAPAVRREVREAKIRREHRESAERMREQAALLDIAPSAILVKDASDRIIFWSRGAERVYGWTPQEAIGRTAIPFMCGEACAAHGDALAALAGTGGFTGECRHRTRDGREIIVESRWLFLPGDKGAPARTLVVNTDVTERKALEAQRLRAQRLESIGALASGIAHDLNNILAPFAMAVDVLKETCADGEARRMLSLLERMAERGGHLTRQILSFVRGLEGEFAPLEPAHLFAETEAILRETMPRSIALRRRVAADILPLFGNCTQVIQVLINLCINARDAMPRGGTLTLSARNETLGPEDVAGHPDVFPGRFVVLSVSDTGAGIPEEIRGKIFDPFFTTKEPGKGTGLGLATVASIVKAHHGFVRVASEAGEGTTIEVHLPAYRKAVPEAEPRKPAEVRRGRGELVLVIDDEASIREMARAALESFDYRVLTAADGVEGVHLFRRNREEIRAVVVDMMMPVMDGRHTIQAIHEIEPRARVIISSGLGEDIAETAGAAADAVLHKPYTVSTLLQTLGDILDMGDKG